MKIGKYKLFGLSNLGLSVMDLYIAKELILPFIFGMGIFTSLGLSIGTLFELVRKVTESGLFLGVALKVLWLRMPEFIVFAFPMSMLLAALMAYSRLSSDSELIALRSIGINPYRLILPCVIFSLVVVGVTFTVNNFVAPAANYQAAITLDKALKESKPTFRESNILIPEEKTVRFPDGKKREVLNRLFYAEEFDGEQMKNITVLDRSQKNVDQIITAQSANWNIADNTWDFFQGTIYLITPDGSYRNIVRFEHQQIAFPRTPIDVARQNRDYNEMSLIQAREYLKVLEVGGKTKKIRKLKVRIQQKIALPFVCLVFGLIGAAIGIKPQNTGKATSFGICIGLIFAYYLLAFICSSLGVWGVLLPFLAAWLPNFLGLSAAGLLLFTSTR
ncbi:MAG: LptF/LptG family permease [Xenococcaceae cyanobacterium MO_188.B32]|nr:LptF/LptG family permease [Xenococcaceae cyanobacterium MO_188.B32]